MDADPIYICTKCEDEYDRTADWDSDVVCKGCGYDWFDCEGCNTTYRTSDLWDDQLFCFSCYHERYPCPDWCAGLNHKRKSAIVYCDGCDLMWHEGAC